MASERKKDTRASKRKPLRYPVWMDKGDSGSLTECMLSDVSEGGAKLKLPSQLAVPTNFSLRLTRNGLPARLCQVMWQDGIDIGIKFIKPAPEASSAQAPVTIKK